MCVDVATICVCIDVTNVCVCVCAGLHPLQKALLIQQKIQQLPPQQQTPPTAPPTAIPHHMTGGAPPSHSGSPVVQSPITLTPGGTAYSLPMVPQPLSQPLTPLQQNVFTMPAGGGAPTNFDPSVLGAQSQQVLSSQVLQKVVSKLAYLGNSPELMQYPDMTGLEKPAAVPGGSQVNPELVERELAVLWLRHSEHLAKQVSPVVCACQDIFLSMVTIKKKPATTTVKLPGAFFYDNTVCLCVQIEQGQLDSLKRKTVDGFFVSGQVTKKQLALAAGEVKTASRNQRYVSVQWSPS